jgi:uncharacterized membrane protein
MNQQFVSRSAIQPRKRALVKTVGYRLAMLAITVAVAWAILGDAGAALNIGLAANILKTGTYYLYERAWDRVRWGIDRV